MDNYGKLWKVIELKGIAHSDVPLDVPLNVPSVVPLNVTSNAPLNVPSHVPLSVFSMSH